MVLAEEYGSKRTITWRQGSRQSTIDLTFVTQFLRKIFVECGITEDMDNHSNHYPIRTVFDLHTVPARQREKRNWDKTDVDALQETLKVEIHLHRLMAYSTTPRTAWMPR